ncbi:MAG: hypothetical protein JXQ96_11550 [Cyclobacteriaceae bacterium]
MREDEGQGSKDKLIEIPKIFYSDLTGAPIEKCISCECNLLEPGRPYMIEKAIKPYDGFKSYSTIFEYAICMPCAEQMRSMISAKSMQNIMKYFSSNIDITGRRKLMQEADYSSVDPWIGQCMIKGMEASEINECQLYAQCNGRNIQFGEFPYMVSGQALDEVIELLSPETLDDLNRFKNEVVDGPSEFQDLLQSGPKVFI